MAKTLSGISMIKTHAPKCAGTKGDCISECSGIAKAICHQSADRSFQLKPGRFGEIGDGTAISNAFGVNCIVKGPHCFLIEAHWGHFCDELVDACS